MKIGLVCPYNIFRGGGVQEHVRGQAAELVKRGHTVKIITPRPRKHIDDAPEDTIFVGNSTPVKTPISTSLELGINLGRTSIDDVLVAEQFDLLHVHEPEVPVLGAQIIAKATCPVFATFHAIHPETPLARTIEALRIPYSRSIFSKLRAITAVSDVAANFVREHAKQDVIIIPNGIDMSQYNFQRSAKPVSNDIVYIGRLERRKGVKYLLQAFEQLKLQVPKAKLIIAGDGPDRNKLEDYVTERQLHGVEFVGYVSDKQKHALLQRAAIFCSPALYGESFGIVLLEAMASGAVTVAGNNSGYKSLMQGRGALSIVNPKDSEEFSRRMQLLLQDDGLRAAWRDWAYAYVRQFDYPVIVDQYERLYKQAVRSA
ncbi:MAG TPA: glycosyltransferase family 4 protein [Patescibacteria group bacterium]|nr:glycosyltransferase family 4 protein [Patescibacteria group bacterium]